MSKLHLPYVEFYITNFCNFNCTGCNRFNNYAFHGQQTWADYEETYRRWSELLDFDQFTILGGEPMTNPDHLAWLKGITQLWPNARGAFLTNGHYLHAENRDLYEAIRATKGRVSVDIGLHNVERRDAVLGVVRNWLGRNIVENRYPKNLNQLYNFTENWKKSYNAIRDPSWPDCDTVEDWKSLPRDIQKECETQHHFSPTLLSEKLLGFELVDSEGVRVLINNENFFHQGALIPNPTKNFTLHNSDPEKAHEICHSKNCHHFDKGLLHKCGQVATLKEFDQQFYLDISDRDRKLIYSYKPGSVDMSADDLLQFVDTLDQPLAQCKFCPETYKISKISAKGGQKVRFLKKSNGKN